MENFNGENLMIFLLAGFSGINLFINYLNKREEALVKIEYPDYSRVLLAKTRDQITEHARDY